jgi:hypothetical protein
MVAFSKISNTNEFIHLAWLMQALRRVTKNPLNYKLIGTFVLVYVPFPHGTGWRKKSKGRATRDASGDVCTCGGSDTTKQETKIGLPV